MRVNNRLFSRRSGKRRVSGHGAEANLQIEHHLCTVPAWQPLAFWSAIKGVGGSGGRSGLSAGLVGASLGRSVAGSRGDTAGGPTCQRHLNLLSVPFSI